MILLDPGDGGPQMADGFLSAEQLRRYGRYTGDPDTAQLARYFYLDVADRALVDVRRGEHNRLGFAVQLCTVRFLGTFLPDPTDVPWSVAAHLAAQLAIADPGVLKSYASRDATNREHAGKIQHVHGYTDFTDPVAQADLRGWLHARTSLGAECPGMLFDLATSRPRDLATSRPPGCWRPRSYCPVPPCCPASSLQPESRPRPPCGRPCLRPPPQRRSVPSRAC